MKLSSKVLGLALASGAIAQQTIAITTTIVIEPSYTGGSYVITVPVGTSKSADNGPAPSPTPAPSVISFVSSEGASTSGGLQISTTTYVANGTTYTVPIPVGGETSVIEVTSSGHTIEETIYVATPTGGADTSSSVAVITSIGTGTSFVSTSANVPTSSGIPPVTTITSTTTTTPSASTTPSSPSSTDSSPVSLTTETSTAPRGTLDPSTLTTVKSTSTATSSVGPVPPAGSSADSLVVEVVMSILSAVCAAFFMV